MNPMDQILIESGLGAEGGASPPILPPLSVSTMVSPLTWDDRGAYKNASFPWLVKKLLPRYGVSVLFGQSGSAKSFLTGELAACVITGGLFFGHMMKATGGVMFALGEAAGAMQDRLEALRVGRFGNEAPVNVETGEALDLDRLPIVTISVDNLSKPAHFDRFAQQVRHAASEMEERHGCPLRLLVIDTVVASFGFEDDPDATKVTSAMKALDGLAQELELCVVAVHHAGKSKSAGEHGSYAWRGSAETSLEVDTVRDGTTGAVTERRLYLKKNRHAGNEGWNQPFELREVHLGTDEDGASISSAIVVPCEREEGANDNGLLAHAPQPQGVKRFLKAFEPTLRRFPHSAPLDDGHRVQATKMAYVRGQYVDDRNDMTDSSARKAFRRDLEAAIAGGFVSTHGTGEAEIIWPLDQTQVA